MKYSRYLGHPFLPSAAEEFSFRWQIAWTIQCSCHDISKILHRRLTNLQNPTAACRTELSMQHGTATIVGFMYSGLLRVRSVRERRHWNFCREAESCPEEFLSCVNHFEEKLSFGQGLILCNSCNGTKMCEHRRVRRQRCISAHRSSSLLCRPALQMLDWLKTFGCLLVRYDLESATYSKLPLASTS